MPNCPSRPSLHFNSICMSKAAKSLRGNQPQRHSLSASLELLKHRRQPLEKANQRVSTGPLWEEKRALILTRWKMPAPTGAPLHTAGLISITWRPTIHQQTETRAWSSSPFTVATKLTYPKKPMNLFPLALEWLFESLNQCGM